MDWVTYETEVIDLGTDVSFTPLVTVDGQGSFTITGRFGSDADGGVTGSYAALAPQSGKRYAQIRVEMADATAPFIRTMTTLLDGDTRVDDYEDVNTATASASWFERVAAGHFRIGAKNDQMASVTSATIRAIQNVGAGWTWVLINKSSTVGGRPAAEFKLYNASGVLADAVIDAELKGPKNT